MMIVVTYLSNRVQYNPRLYQTIEFKFGGDIFCTEFRVDSESGLKINLGGRISELSLSLS